MSQKNVNLPVDLSQRIEGTKLWREGPFHDSLPPPGGEGRDLGLLEKLVCVPFSRSFAGIVRFFFSNPFASYPVRPLG